MSPQVIKDHQQAEQIFGVLNTVVIMQCSGKVWCMLYLAMMVLSGLVIMSIYFTSADDDNEVNMGPGDDLSIVKKKFRVAPH